MKLDGSQRRQMHQALIHSFHTIGALRRMLSFGLNVRLEEIPLSNSQNLPDVIFDVIEWAESQGRLPELVNAASEHSKSSEWRDFVEQAWKPLEAQLGSMTSISRQSDKQILSKPVSLTKVQSGTQGSSMKKPDTRRKHSRGAGRGNTKREKHSAARTNARPAGPQLPPPSGDHSQQKTRSSEDILLLAHNHVSVARGAIQVVIDLFQPEEESVSDHCEEAIANVKVAEKAIQKIPNELSQISSPDASLRYILENEQTYFIDEARKVEVILQELSEQMPPLPLQEDLRDKLHSLMESLQEVDDLVDVFSKRIEKS